MKNKYSILAIIALITLATCPIVTRAQSNVPRKIGQEILNNFREKQDNAKANQNIRNNRLEDKASTTRSIMNGSTTRPWNGTTTPPLGRNNPDGRQFTDNGKSMFADFFGLRKQNIVKELQKALNNLKNIRNRIESRIDKVASTTTSNSRDMTEARRLLVIADNKISVAQNAVKLIGNLSATSTVRNMASSTASTTIDLNRPRLMANEAQKAIKDAQRALNDVVVAIAHAMGLKLGNNGTNATTTSP